MKRSVRTLSSLFALTLLPTGCNSPSAPTPPPGGGDDVELDYDVYVQTVAPVLERLGCNAAACHGGGIRGTYALSPSDAPNSQFDFDQTQLQVNVADPDASPLLLEPLRVDAGGSLHQEEPFATTDDPDYVTLRAWIAAGGSE